MQAKQYKVVRGGDVSEGPQLERSQKVISFSKSRSTEIFQGARISYLCPRGPEILAMPLNLSIRDGEIKKRFSFRLA